MTGKLSINLMKSPLQRIRTGAMVLVIVFAIAVLGYRILGNYDWIDAIWMVVITISTVGHSEHSELSATLQLFTVAVILFGMTAAVYTFGGLFQLILEGELERLIGNRRMEKELEQLDSHVLICGYGRMGKDLAQELKIHKRQIVVIDIDPNAVEEARAGGILCFQGNATEEEVLRSLKIEQAAALVTTLPSDAESVFITLTARNLNPGILIIARAEHQSTESKLRQAGANKVVMPTVIGARQMVRMIRQPFTADVIELVNETSFAELELEEFVVKANGRLLNVSVKETEAFRRHKLLVIAIKESDGHLTFNPPADRRFNEGDTVMLMGHAGDIERFTVEYLN